MSRVGRAASRRRRDPLWARLLVVFGALLMVASGGAIIGAKILIGQYTNGIPQRPLLGGAGNPGQGGHHSIDGALNILLVGIDQRPEAPGDLIRSDSIIVVHIPATHDQAYLLSIPRDLLVEIPPYPKTGYRGGKDKINAAFAFGSEGTGGREGGFELLGLTIKALTGITFDAGAIIDFGGFRAVVDALGGVDMCIDERVVSHHIGYDKFGNTRAKQPGDRPVVYEPGCQHFKPWQALDYVRQRYGLPNGDYDRQRHQQQFLTAMLAAAKKQGVTSNPLKLYNVINAAGQALTVDTNGIAIDDWLFTLRGVIDHNVVMLKTNGGKVNSAMFNGSSVEQLTEESRQMFEAVKADRLDAFVALHSDFVSSEGIGG